MTETGETLTPDQAFKPCHTVARKDINPNPLSQAALFPRRSMTDRNNGLAEVSWFPKDVVTDLDASFPSQGSDTAAAEYAELPGEERDSHRDILQRRLKLFFQVDR